MQKEVGPFSFGSIETKAPKISDLKKQKMMQLLKATHPYPAIIFVFIIEINYTNSNNGIIKMKKELNTHFYSIFSRKK